MNVRVDAARGDDLAFARDYFGARSHDHAGRYAVHYVRIAGFADSDDAIAANADVGFGDAGVVDDDRVGDDQIERAVSEHGGGRLAHAVAQAFAAAEFGFVAGRGEIFFNFDEESRCPRGGRDRPWWVRRVRRTGGAEFSGSTVCVSLGSATGVR